MADPRWRAVALYGGPHADDPRVVVYREDPDGSQRRLVSYGLTPGDGPSLDRADEALAGHGWLRDDDLWVGDGVRASADIRRVDGRPPAGTAARTRLWLDDLEAVDDIAAILGQSRSQTIAWLVHAGLQALG